MYTSGALKSRGMLALSLFSLAAGACFAGNGDIVPDGKIDKNDVSFALRIAGGLLQSTSTMVTAGDTVVDGHVNLPDAVRIARIAAGIDPPIGAASSIALPTDVSVTVAGNTTKDIKLTGGFSVQGTIKDTANQPVVGEAVLKNTSTLVTYTAYIFPSDGSYTVNVPAGTYQTYVQYSASDTGSNAESVSRSVLASLGSPFTVSANVTGRNFVRPNAATTSNVTVSFTGAGLTAFAPENLVLAEGSLENYSSINYVSTRLSSTAADTFPAQNATYSISLGGSYSFTDTSTEQLNITYGTTLVVNNAAVSRALSVPALHTFSGTVTLPAGSSATLEDVGVFSAATSGDIYYASYDITPTGHYEIATAPGSYYLGVDIQLSDDSTIEWVQPLTVTTTSPTTQNVTLPAIPTMVTLSGHVTGPNGAASPNAFIDVEDASQTVPAGGRYSYAPSTTADAAGAYSVKVIPGSFTVTATPSS